MCKEIQAQHTGEGIQSLVIRLLELDVQSQPQVFFLSVSCPSPFQYDPEEFHTVQDINLYSSGAKFVGINKACEIENENHAFPYMCSDSFSPCVPIIGFKMGSCIFSHTNGLLALPHIEPLVGNGECTFLIIQKTSHKPNLIKALIERLSQWGSVIICKVNTTSTIGVIVCPRTQAVVVYDMD